MQFSTTSKQPLWSAAFFLCLLGCLLGFSSQAFALDCPNPKPTYQPTLSKPTGLNPQPGCHYNSKANYFVDTSTWLNSAEPWDISDNGKITGAWWYVNKASCPDYSKNFNQWYNDAYQVAYYQKYSVTRTDSTSFQKDGSPILLKAPMSNATDPNGNSLSAKSYGRAVNNDGYTVGYGEKGAYLHAFLWRAANQSSPAVTSDTRSNQVLKSSDPSWDLGEGAIANDSGTLNSTHTYALDVSPVFNISASTPGIVVVGMRDSNRENPDSVEPTTVTQTDSTRRILAPSGQTRAMFWKVSAANLNAALTGASPTLSYESRTVPGMSSLTSEARAVNAVGTIVGTANGFGGSSIRGFACIYPCALNGDVKVLRPIDSGHTQTYALAVNDWKTTAGTLPGTEPGQVFGLSQDSTGKRHPVVWTWNSITGDYNDAVEINNPAASSSQAFAANSFGVAVGTQDGQAAVFRDGRYALRLADSVRLYDQNGSRVNLSFYAALAVNRGGTMIVRGRNLTANGTYTINFLMKPTFYNVSELVSSTTDGLAKAMDYYGDYVVGRSKQSATFTGAAPKQWQVTNPMTPAVATSLTELDFTSRNGDVNEANAIQPFGGMIVGSGYSNLEVSSLTRSNKQQGLVWDTGGNRRTIWDSSLTKYLTSATGLSSSNIGVGNGYAITGTLSKSLATSTAKAYGFRLTMGGCGFSVLNGTCATLYELGTGYVFGVNDAFDASGQNASNAAVVWSLDGNGARTSTAVLPSHSTYSNNSAAKAVSVALDGNPTAAIGYGKDSSNHKAGLYWEKSGTAWSSAPTAVRINGADTEFFGVNGRSQAVGTAQLTYYYFRVSGGSQTDVGAFYDRNNTQEDTEGNSDGVTGMAQDLSSMTSPDSGWLQLKSAYAINDLGIIVGQGIKLDGTVAAFIATPPLEADSACW